MTGSLLKIIFVVEVMQFIPKDLSLSLSLSYWIYSHENPDFVE